MPSTEPAPADSGGRLLGLDGLRGLAAIWVLLFHLELRYQDWGMWNRGYLAVDIFFVLSGYVMARTYEGRWLRGLGTRAFMAARLRRLQAPYAIGCLIGLVFVLTGGLGWHEVPAWLITFVLAAFFLPSPFSPTGLFGLNTPGWSLMFELLANLWHALLFVRLSFKALVIFWLLCAIGLVVTAFSAGGISAGSTVDLWPLNLFRILVSYLAGILLFRTLHGGGIKLPLPAAMALLVGLVVGALATKGIASDLFFVLGFCPLLVFAATRFQAGSGLSAAAEFLGALSYPLYAVHMPVIYFCQRFGLPLVATGVIALLVGLIVARATNPRKTPQAVPSPA